MTESGPPVTDEEPPGRVRRTVAWSKTTAQAAAEWAHGARGDHATVDIGFRVAERDRRAAAMVLAGGIAYRVFFWLLAVSLMAGGVLGYFDPDQLDTTLQDHGSGAWLAEAAASVARSADGNEWWLLLVGAWLALWAGYTCSKALVLTHAAVWQIKPPRVTRPLHAALAFNGLTLGFIGAMAVARWLREGNSDLGLAATLLVIVVPLAFWLWASKLLPNEAASWRELVPGAVVVAVGLQGMHIFTTYFLGPKLTSATQLYGVIGVTTTILFWFYLAGRLIIAAATLNSSLAEHRRSDERRD